MTKWGTDNYAASDSFSRYIVVASDKCMGGRANDGFDQFNLLLRYHKNGAQSRMELLLAGPTLPGRTYEGLVNYDIPHSPPSYWNIARRGLLSPLALQACLAYYPPRRAGTTYTLSARSRERIQLQSQNALNLSSGAQFESAAPKKGTPIHFKPRTGN